MKVLIYGNTLKKNSEIHVKSLINKLKLHAIDICIYLPYYELLKSVPDLILNNINTFTYEHEVDDAFDFMFSLGGDGTLLKSVQYVQNKNIPIVGINMGRLGFLANIPQEDISFLVDEIVKQNYTLDHRSLIHFIGYDDMFDKFPYALNDVTVQKKDTSMISIHTYLNNELLNSYWADGLIISTSTGSTAYSLSVGGPIVLPSAHNFVISPIAPHNLAVRPIIVPNEYQIKLVLESRSTHFLATVDNRTEILKIGSEINLCAADFGIQLLHLKNYNFYNTIRNKLSWGIDKRN